jgi:zinc transport system substrate-binding protein
MKKLLFLTICILLLCIILTGCSESAHTKLKVVTGTSLIAYITQQVGGDRVDVINLITPAQQPGDFKNKPGDVEKLASAKVFILHGWPGEAYADKFIASANNPNLLVIKANVDGNWMIPSMQLAATDKLATILIQIDSKNTTAYQKSAEEYKQKILAKEIEIKNKIKNYDISKVNVLASFRQADFLKWTGLNIAATYGDPETLAPQVLKGLVDKGKELKVSIIVDNLQNGKDAGKAIAEELGAKQINLSNFPGGLENTETWEKAIDKNIELLLRAIAR